MSATGEHVGLSLARNESRPTVRVGLLWVSYAPLSNIANAIRLARLARLDHVVFGDHVQNFVPRAIFDERLGY